MSEGFYGTRIFDGNESYYTEVDVKHDLSFNIGEGQAQEVLLKKKPYYTTFGQANYWSGTCSGLLRLLICLPPLSFSATIKRKSYSCPMILL